MGDKTVSRPDIGVNEHWESIGNNADGLEEHVQGVSVEKAALPTGAATETTLSAINTKLGEVQANPTSNTLLDRLKALLTGIVLAAGSNIIGRVGFDQTTPGTTESVTVATGQGAGATIGVTSGAAVTTDVDGTIQQYLRGLAKNLLAKVGFDSTDNLKVVRNSVPVVTGATGAGAVNTTTALSYAHRVKAVTLHLSAAPTTAENLVITLDALAGAAYDTVLKTIPMVGVTDVYWTPDGELLMADGDEIKVTYTNTDARTFGLRIVTERAD